MSKAAACDLCGVLFKPDDDHELIFTVKNSTENAPTYHAERILVDFTEFCRFYSPDLCPQCKKDIKDFLHSKNPNIY